MGDGRIFLKFSVPLSLVNTYKMNLISAGSISLDSTFNSESPIKRKKENRFWKEIYVPTEFSWMRPWASDPTWLLAKLRVSLPPPPPSPFSPPTSTASFILYVLPIFFLVFLSQLGDKYLCYRGGNFTLFPPFRNLLSVNIQWRGFFSSALPLIILFLSTRGLGGGGRKEKKETFFSDRRSQIAEISEEFTLEY